MGDVHCVRAGESGQKTGVLLINLGTPSAPDARALRAYLGQFLADPRVVELPRWLWLPILHGVILNLRPRRSARKYATIWREDGAPLLVHTQAQARDLARHFAGERHIEVSFAMRYGQPDIASAIDDLLARGVTHLVALPLYPQYSAASTASALDAVFLHCQTLRNLPRLSTLRDFHDHPAYINALASQVRAHWAQHGRAACLLMSFHGMPRATLERGDPYYHECLRSAALLAAALELDDSQWRIGFQSRFGAAAWLQPYTVDVLAELGQAGTRSLDVICPGFVADCLETLEEIAIEGAALFQSSGGGDYRYIPCLNNNKDWIDALARIVSPFL